MSLIQPLALFGCFSARIAATSCIGDDLWQQYNLAAVNSTCQVDSACESEICRAGRCQSSRGAVGLNCRDDKDCDSGLCEGSAEGYCLPD